MMFQRPRSSENETAVVLDTRNYVLFHSYDGENEQLDLALGSRETLLLQMKSEEQEINEGEGGGAQISVRADIRGNS